MRFNALVNVIYKVQMLDHLITLLLCMYFTHILDNLVIELIVEASRILNVTVNNSKNGDYIYNCSLECLPDSEWQIFSINSTSPTKQLNESIRPNTAYEVTCLTYDLSATKKEVCIEGKSNATTYTDS